MQRFKRKLLSAAVLAAVAGLPLSTGAAVFIQCPGDVNDDAVPDVPVYDEFGNERNIHCMHLVAGDGFSDMADDGGREIYTFGFSDHTGTPADQVLSESILGANWPAPTIELNQGEEFYLTLSNVGTIIRPDLFDPHTVHFHGFPNATTIFDGEPDASISIGQGNSVTYYYKILTPGTYMYHCHVEATEHMQLGMLGNLFVNPAQNGTSIGGYTTFAYNDGDGSTGYDVQYALQLGSFDPDFHDASLAVQPLPFADMEDKYAMINGRGYPDTVNLNPLPPPPNSGANIPSNPSPQPISSLVEATAGERILLRLSNLNVTNYYTMTALGLPMQVIGQGSKHLRGKNGDDLYYHTASVTLGGGESVDVIIDTTGIAAGTYFLYTTNLNYLSNNEEDFGGMMTEIRIN
jgi:FtsP/CotA-like multicopper oxidase with cupredoxin domain